MPRHHAPHPQTFIRRWQTLDDDGVFRVWNVRIIDCGPKGLKPESEKRTVSAVMAVYGLNPRELEDAFASNKLENNQQVIRILNTLTNNSNRRQIEMPFIDRKAIARYIAFTDWRSPAVKKGLIGEDFPDIVSTKEQREERFNELLTPGRQDAEAMMRETAVAYLMGKWTLLDATDTGKTFILSSCPEEHLYRNVVGQNENWVKFFPIGPFHALQIVCNPKDIPKSYPHWIGRESVDAQKIEKINAIKLDAWDKFQDWVVYGDDEPTATWLKDSLYAELKGMGYAEET